MIWPNFTTGEPDGIGRVATLWPMGTARSTVTPSLSSTVPVGSETIAATTLSCGSSRMKRRLGAVTLAPALPSAARLLRFGLSAMFGASNEKYDLTDRCQSALPSSYVRSLGNAHHRFHDADAIVQPARHCFGQFLQAAAMRVDGGAGDFAGAHGGGDCREILARGVAAGME